MTRTHGIDKDLWYGQGLMVLTTPMVLTQTHGIESVILNHTLTRGPSVTRMRDFFKRLSLFVSRTALNLFLLNDMKRYWPYAWYLDKAKRHRLHDLKKIGYSISSFVLAFF